jgi:outer membrane lipoprotein-sorting protein
VKSLFIVGLTLGAIAMAAPDAAQIMKQTFDVSKVKDSDAEATFTLVSASGEQRVRKTHAKTKLIAGTSDNQRVTRFLSPADVKGTSILLVEHTGKDDDLWIYLPALKKVRRLVSSNKKDSFAGTDFSYGDVIGHKPEDWKHKYLRNEKVGAYDCRVIESTPKNDDVKNDSGYAKRVSWVDNKTGVTVKGELFDTNGELLKRYSADKIEEVDKKEHKFQPMRLESENVQSKHKTILTFEHFKANTGVKNDFFTTRFLEKDW